MEDSLLLTNLTRSVKIFMLFPNCCFQHVSSGELQCHLKTEELVAKYFYDSKKVNREGMKISKTGKELSFIILKKSDISIHLIKQMRTSEMIKIRWLLALLDERQRSYLGATGCGCPVQLCNEVSHNH